MKPKIIIILVLILISLSSGYGMGQQTDTPTVDVELSRSKVYVGDELTYQIIVRGIDQPSDPVIEFPPGVQVVFRGRSSQSFSTTRIINGRNRMVTDRRYSFQYSLTAIDVGIIDIPAPAVQFQGSQYTGPPMSFDSIYPVESNDDVFTVELDRTNLYVNETIHVQCQWLIAAKTTEFSFASSQIPDTLDVLGLELQANGVQQIGFQFAGQRVVGVVVEDQTSGNPIQRLVFRFAITPTQAGLFELGPMRVVFTRHSGTGRSFRAYTESEPISISVSEVPTQNQPSAYSGIIGEFDLKIHASNTSVNVGDPIDLTLIIEGDEPMGGLDRSFSATDMSGFRESFKVSTEGWREILPRQPGKRMYETVVRALSDSVQEIPPVVLPSFNPLTESFEVYRSNTIPLEIQAVTELTLSDAVIVGGLQRATNDTQIEYTTLSHLTPELWAHASSSEMTNINGLSLTRALRDPKWIATICAGPSVFAFAGLLGYSKKRRNPVRKQHRKLLRQSQSLERQGNHAQSIRVYLATVLSIDPDCVVAQDADKLPIDTELKARIVAAIHTDEQHAYLYLADSASVSKSPNAPPLLKELRQALRKGEVRS